MYSFLKVFFRVFFQASLVVVVSASASGQMVDDRYDEFVLGNKIFKPYCGYISIASGLNYNPDYASMEKCFSLGYHFRIMNSHFQTGYHVTSDEYFMKRSYQMLSDIYFMYGFRKDTVKYNWGIYAGPTYGFGSTLAYVNDNSGIITNYYLSFHKVGIYTEAEYTFKVTYDFGLGLSAYLSANEEYKVAGLKVHLYFSGAFRGKIE